MSVLPVGYHTTETMVPQKLEFSQESQAGGRKWRKHISQKRNLSPERYFTESNLITLLDKLLMGQ